MAIEPTINDQFPVRESLSPPVIDPVHECPEAVHVSSFVPHAMVRVFAGGGELLAEDRPLFGFADIQLNRSVGLGESLTATQTAGGTDSKQSQPPVVVSALPESEITNTKPVVGGTLFECGQVVPVTNLVSGCRVHVRENNTEIAVEPGATANLAVVTPPLHKDALVTAQQIGCEGTDHEVAGQTSDPPVQVLAAPIPTPAPHVDAASLIPGNDVVTLTGLLVGATVEVFSGGASVGSGLATAGANWVPLSSRLSAAPVTATQQLCGNVSVPSAPQTPAAQLTAPIVVGPICAGAHYVLVRGTVVNATVVVLRNGTPVGYGGAAPGDVLLELGTGETLHSGDSVTAVQYMGSTLSSPPSNAVIVVRRLSQPAVEILGGHPFFLAKGEEKPIDGPVFPRGLGPGPGIRMQACCSGVAKVRILDPSGNVIAEPELTELYPGYFTASWPWVSSAGWPVPAGVPVGRYTVVAHADCVEQEASAFFYVIFDPAEVGGPARFSFDATAVWFGTGPNTVRGLHYYLHPSDARVFQLALNAVSGMTSAFAAADRLALAEEKLFSYSLDYHTNDVVDLITNFSEAQCADDACCLTAMLRAMGIPAHPVTADAGVETGAANWTFDTWVEFLASDAGAVEWRIFHPHQYPNQSAQSRRDFGTTRAVALKSFNDIIVMAGESWVAANLDDGTDDVSYGRNECQEPLQALTKASWVDELCEAGYWAQTHWDCAGVHTNGLSAGNGFRFSDESLRFDGHATGTVEVRNDGPERLFGTFTVELVGHRLESKRPAEVTYAETRASVAVDPAETLTVPFRFVLPQTLPPGQELVIRAKLDERTADLRQLRLPIGVQGELDWPADLQLGDESTVRLVVRNVTDQLVRDVTADLDAPFALLPRDRTRRELGDLQAGEERELSWVVRAAAPMDSGSLHVAVSTGNSGSQQLRRTFRVQEPTAPVPALPSLPLPA